MKINQPSPLLNEVVAEMYGQNAPDVANIDGLISLGKEVLSSSDNTENFMGVLANRIKRTVLRRLDFDIDLPKILMDNESFFGILQKINVEPFTVVDDNSWNIGEDDYATTIWNINKPSVKQSLFHNISAFTIPVTIPDVMLKSAFTSITEMNNFISGVFASIESSLKMYINACTHLAICNLIGEKAKDSKVIFLADLYNEQFPLSPVTFDNARFNPEFLRFCAMTIRNYTQYMKNPSVLYNDGTIVRATPRDNMHVVFLADFISAFEMYLQSDTYHKELTELPLFGEVSYWQNQGDSSPTFDSNSTVYVCPQSEADEDTPKTYKLEGTICMLADREAVGVTLQEDWSGTDRNNRERYTNYTYGANRGYFNDLSENVCIFALTASKLKVSDLVVSSTRSNVKATAKEAVKKIKSLKK